MKWLSFAVSRVFRLVPLFYVLVAIMVVLGLARGVTDWTADPVELARRISGWLFFTIRTGPGFDTDETTWLIVGGVAWTLRYEWAFYLALPLAAAIFTKARSWPAAIVAVLAIALLVRATRFYPLQPEHFRAFLGGIVTAYWIRSPRLRQIARSRLFGAAGLAAAVIVLCQYEMTRPDIIALLTLLFIGLTCENPLFKILCAAPLRWMGEISYGLYLLHGLFIWAGVYVFAPLVSGRPVSDLTVCLYAAAATPLLVALATFLNIAVEQPGIDLGRHVANHRWRRGLTNPECRLTNAPSGVR
jgi:peptidoglycan/LPS O-acetylase OafA/YrhL